MKKGIKGFVLGIICGVLVAGTVVMATNTTTLYDVITGIKIIIDGEELDARDVNGDKVEPFIYNGTTYLPVRAVAEALDKDVRWDGIEKVVYLGTKTGETENWMTQCEPYQYNKGDAFKRSENNFFTMSGMQYTDGFVLHTRYTGKTDGDRAEALFNLNGKYNTVSFKVGHIDGTNEKNHTLNVYLDGLLEYTKELQYDDVAKTVTVPLDGALQMKIEITGGVYDKTAYGFSEGLFE